MIIKVFHDYSIESSLIEAIYYVPIDEPEKLKRPEGRIIKEGEDPLKNRSWVWRLFHNREYKELCAKEAQESLKKETTKKPDEPEKLFKLVVSYLIPGSGLYGVSNYKLPRNEITSIMDELIDYVNKTNKAKPQVKKNDSKKGRSRNSR